MKYSVKCNHCGKTFVAETEKYGRFKYRCPYCNNVVTCQFDKPENLTVEASSVIPVSNSQLSLPYYVNMPVVEAKVIHASVEALKSAGRSVGRVGQKSKTTMTKILDHIEVFFGWSGTRISKFRREYDDADLWLFFGFSILFILLVLFGLYILAGFTKILAASHSAIFKYWIEFRNGFNNIF
jgi:phage FluMu protein Com